MTMARIYAPNGHHYKKEAEGMPAVMLVEKDGELDIMTHQERAFLKRVRALPDDLRPKFMELMQDESRPMKERMAEFSRLLDQRREEFCERFERITRGEELTP